MKKTKAAAIEISQSKRIKENIRIIIDEMKSYYSLPVLKTPIIAMGIKNELEL